MKTFDELFNGVIKHEGYYANVTGDRGGETYMGVARNLHPNWQGWQIIDEFKKQAGGNIKRNTQIHNQELLELVRQFYCYKFYKRNLIGKINDGCLQEIIFDWIVNSGFFGRKGVQKVLNNEFGKGLTEDGIIGGKTIQAINACNAKALFEAIKKARIDYYHRIAQKGQNHKFLNGWLKRINSISYSI